MNGGKTWSSLRPVVQPETQEECEYYRYPFSNTPAKQSHDGYQLLVGDRLFLFFGWNKGSQPPVGEKIPRTDMQLDDGFWMKWSDDFGANFGPDGLNKAVCIPVRSTKINVQYQACTKKTLKWDMTPVSIITTTQGQKTEFSIKWPTLFLQGTVNLYNKINLCGHLRSAEQQLTT